MTTTDPWADTRRRLGANDDMRATDAYKAGFATSSVRWVLDLLAEGRIGEATEELHRCLAALTYGDDDRSAS